MDGVDESRSLFTALRFFSPVPARNMMHYSYASLRTLYIIVRT